MIESGDGLVKGWGRLGLERDGFIRRLSEGRLPGLYTRRCPYADERCRMQLHAGRHETEIISESPQGTAVVAQLGRWDMVYRRRLLGTGRGN